MINDIEEIKLEDLQEELEGDLQEDLQEDLETKEDPIKLGEIQTLKIVRETPIGVYLNITEQEDEYDVLLPMKQVPEDASVGDDIEVFIYRDSEDRLIATTKTPKITLGEIVPLKVIDTTDIGAFLHWGLDKDLLLPFSEQLFDVEEDDKYLCGLYIDKSDRLCATMYIDKLLETNTAYEEGEWLDGIIYNINSEFGASVAVENKYYGLIHYSDFYGNYQIGSQVEVRVTKVREDGKLDLSLRNEAFKQMDPDSDLIYKKLIKEEGFLPFNDKSSPEKINKNFGMSKGAYKRAIGRLFKERKILITKDGVEQVVEEKEEE